MRITLYRKDDLKVKEKDFVMQNVQPKTPAKEDDIAGAGSDFSATPAAIPEKAVPPSQDRSSSPDDKGGGPEQTAVIKVKFNKQERTYSPEQAAPLVEMGLKWDSFRPQYEKLKYLASIQEKTVGELIDQLLEDSDNRLYSQIFDQAGGDEAEAKRTFEKQKAERQKRFEQLCLKEAEDELAEHAKQQALTEQRLADDFLKLSEEFSGCFGSFSDVPEAVVECAVSENIPLLDAYLRYRHREAKRIAAEQSRQIESAARSPGSLSDAGLSPSFELDEFEQAFYKALQ